MKLIINVKRSNQYSKYNGMKFKINPNDLMVNKNGKLIIPIKGLNPLYPNNFVDFNQDEILFVSK